MKSPIGQYNVLERLGGGALGDVFRARDTRAGRTVALMVAPPTLIATPDQRARFLADARKAAKLSHPNIAMLFDVVERDDGCYLAYEFAAGPALREEMGGTAVEVRHALHLAAHIADALAGGHAHGMIHGDLRPETIVVTPKGSVKVLNFGMTVWTLGGVARAKAARAPESLEGEESLIAAYLAPEQALGPSTDPRSDLFSFGLIFYEMLTGRHPFIGATPATTVGNVLARTAPRPSSVNSSLPSELDGIVMKLLAKEPDARYPTATAAAADIRRISSELDARMDERESVPQTPQGSRAWLWIGLVALAGIVAAALWVFTRT